jgi:hypothetical protein
MVVPFGVALALAIGVLAWQGTGVPGIGLGLSVTGRWSFLPFWIAYTGGSMAVLFGPKFGWLARHGREFGLAFASAHTVHLGLVIWLYQIATTPPLTFSIAAFFTLGAVFTYLLAALSFGGWASGRYWRLLRSVGMNYILCAFAFDFVLPLIDPRSEHLGSWQYIPVAVMCVVAPVLRLAARRRRLRVAPTGVY